MIYQTPSVFLCAPITRAGASPTLAAPAHRLQETCWRGELGEKHPMDVEDYNSFCGSLPHAKHVVQWRGAHVWKIGGKVFAVGHQDKGEPLHVSFKCSRIAFEALSDAPGFRPAPYLASRGFSWIQSVGSGSTGGVSLRAHIRESYRLVVAGLSKGLRAKLKLDGDGKQPRDTVNEPGTPAKKSRKPEV